MAGRWLLILGVSSGFGAAVARTFAAEDWDIAGIHLDRRSGMPAVEALQAEIRALGREALFFNVNAADDQRRQEVIAALKEQLPVGGVGIFLHSLAFGSLVPFVAGAGKKVSRAQLEMTVDVMGHSLVWWTQDLVATGLMAEGGRIYAMTSAGSHHVWPGYGPVSAAKSVLESHVRQLAMELAPQKITVNALLAGVTRTAALEKIPGSDKLIEKSLARNPSGRLTEPLDVARCMLELCRPGTYWLTGNVLRVDGGEDISG